MKHFVVGLMLLAGLAQAEEGFQTIKVERHAGLVRVNSVSKVIEGEHGFPMVHVYAQATFGNSCEVPRTDELVLVTQYSKNYETLNLTVADESQRACPAVYMPVTVTLDLGVYSKPNDGLFRKILVNGVTAN